MPSPYLKSRFGVASGYPHVSHAAHADYVSGYSAIRVGGYLPQQHLDEDWTLPDALRVAHLGPCFLQGGAEQQAIDLLHALRPSRARIERFLVMHPELISAAKAASATVPVEVVDGNAIRKAVNEFDIVLCWGLELDAVLAGIPRTARTIYIAHGMGEWVNRQLMSSVHSTDHVVAVSELVRRSLCCSLPVTVIPNGVDAKRIAASRPRREVRSELGFAPTDFVTGFVGRFSPEKRPELLVHALSRLAPQHKGLFVGYGPLETELLQLANQLIPGRYAFAFADDYLGDYYGAMDCFCLSSDEEGFALVLLEAMMAGKPVISTNVGGAPELVRHRQTGVIVESSPESIAAAIDDIASSAEWARGMAASAAKLADNMGHASQMARRYEALFASLCPVSERGMA
ncbi:MAG: glycosyltransferase family 4 protein [Pirellulaceae bacterium]